jgi:hypothetical protein
MVPRIDTFEGITLLTPKFSDALASGLKQLQTLSRLESGDLLQKVAIASSVHSFNILMTAAATVCQRSATEGDAEIDLISNSSGELIYRCKHDPSHEWDLDGHVIR